MGKKVKRKLSMLLVCLMVIGFIPLAKANAADTIAGNGRLLVGYWHNFDNGAGIVKIRDVDPSWDIINVSFGETFSDRAVVELHPCYDEKEFIADIAYVQSKGKKVVLSLGGAEGVIQIPNDTAREKFMTSVTGLIEKYGFNGIDIDLEGGSGMILQPGDTDLNNPTTPQIVNFIKVIKDLVKKYGDEFIISMAPELAYVQGGNTGYATNWGAYLPLINAVRNELDFLQVQHYNCGGNMALDGVIYNQGTADFQVAMVDMLLQGFETKASKNSFFAPLKQEQVVIGLPASQRGTLMPNSGYTPPAEVLKALNYLVKGQSYGGQYKMIGEKYPNLRGIMAWSINWDNVNNKEFVKAYRPFFDSLPPIVPEKPLLRAASVRASAVTNNSYTITIDVPGYNTATSYELFENGRSVATGQLTAAMTINQLVKKDFSNKEYGTYTYSVRVKDSVGEVRNVVDCIVEVKDPSENTNKEDVNNDGVVDLLDLTAVSSKYNLSSGQAGYEVKYDVNRDGTVDIFDIVKVAKKVGDVDPPGPSDNYWKSGTSYKVGDKVNYQGKTYECIFAHTSHEGWLPGTVPTLWKEV